VIELGREHLINVWIAPQGPEWRPDLRLSNLDLALLLAYKLQRNWNGQINLCMAVKDAETAEKANAFLDDLITLARLPANTQAMVWQAPLAEALAQAPRADLSSFGLPREPDLAFFQHIVEMVDGSCIFVRDSGDESALA
jgi:hypothetical protein